MTRQGRNVAPRALNTETSVDTNAFFVTSAVPLVDADTAAARLRPGVRQADGWDGAITDSVK